MSVVGPDSDPLISREGFQNDGEGNGGERRTEVQEVVRTSEGHIVHTGGKVIFTSAAGASEAKMQTAALQLELGYVIDFDDLEVGSRIGCGSHGEVRRGW